jgi:hypothetical protein
VGFFSDGPWSFRSAYDRDVASGLGRTAEQPLLTEADLASLPPVVQQYVRQSGAMGKPRVQNFRARFHGQIRSGPDAGWMSFTGEQVNCYDEPSRVFLMNAKMFGLPVQAYHRFVGLHATMRVKLACLASVVDAKGPAMDEAETVTLFNDLCVFAPAALIDKRIIWEPIDAISARASFTNFAYTARAVLMFNARSELINFIADGRGAMSPDGKTVTKMSWSTPLRDYREFNGRRLMTCGEGVWHASKGVYSYLRFELDDIEYNVSTP